MNSSNNIFENHQISEILMYGKVIYMKATGIVRRIDDLGRVVIPKEIRRTMRIREGDPLQTTLTSENKFIFAMLELSKRIGLNCEE